MLCYSDCFSSHENGERERDRIDALGYTLVLAPRIDCAQIYLKFVSTRQILAVSIRSAKIEIAKISSTCYHLPLKLIRNLSRIREGETLCYNGI